MQKNEPCEREDWDLAERAGRGDEDAYAALVARHQNSIHSFIFRSLGDEEVTRDLTQEVFVKAWFALPQVRRTAKFTTWLFQIGVNLCRDYAKSKTMRHARVTHSLVRGSGDQAAGEREFRHPDVPPDRQVELSETMAVLDEEIRRLPEDLRQPFLLGAVEGHAYKEVASMLHISPKAVETRVYRARKWLTTRLKERGLLNE